MSNEPSSPSGRRVVSLFSGAGGLDLGLERAGWRIVAQVEMDADCAGTLANEAARVGVESRAGSELAGLGDQPIGKGERAILCSPIEGVDPGQLRDALGLEPGALDLLAGGPPCQPFTTTGLRKAITDRRAETAFPTWLKYVDSFQPRAFLMENVDGLLSAALKHRPLARRGKGHPPLDDDEKKGSFLRWLLTELCDRGYSVTWGVVEAADYGVPQMRQRALLVGVRGDQPCYFPPPVHGRPGLPAYRTLAAALDGLDEIGSVQPLSARKTAVFAQVPAGGNWRDLPEDVRRETMGAAFDAEGGKSGWWRRLAWDAPSPTILGMPDHSSTALVHPDHVRCLSVNECAAVQTFPASVDFAGTSRSQYQQIGNAVPPLLAEHMAEHLGRWLEGERTPRPPAPAWRKASANRRIGVHGWATPSPRGARFEIIVKIRPDHVWAEAKKPRQAELPLAAAV